MEFASVLPRVVEAPSAKLVRVNSRVPGQTMLSVIGRSRLMIEGFVPIDRGMLGPANSDAAPTQPNKHSTSGRFPVWKSKVLRWTRFMR